MAIEDAEMVILDGVRWKRADVERLFPERVKDALPPRVVAEYGHGTRVTTVPGGVVTGETKLGEPVVDTTVSAAGNGVIVDGPGEPGGLGDEGKASRNGSQRRAGAKKQ